MRIAPLDELNERIGFEKDSPMKLLSIAMLMGLSAIGGAVAFGIIGFNWLGWATSITVEETARSRAETAVIDALSPICVQKFREQSGADESLVRLKRFSAWQQANFISRGGWATPPGSSTPNLDVARACAATLTGTTT